MTAPTVPDRATAAVELVGVGRSFDGRTVLAGVDLTLADGEFVALLGRSGSGKSTLLRILAGLDAAAIGSVTVRGSVAVAFQEPRLLPWRPVWRNIVLGLRREPGDPPARTVALEALAEVGLAERADAWPLTLSGGEAQRASLARALVRRPRLLLLDEPFGALDALTRLSVHRLVTDLWQRHRPAVLLVTHDVDEALQLADRVLVLDDGRIAGDLPVAVPRPRPPEALAGLRRAVLGHLGLPQS
ncbi:MAG: sulfonate transporter ATP-binding protein [Mycobacterium sp.]|jgi:sulfonate transport system ATP-binding protein|nr:sulfonate transporter ATP-binding protein [Mycobacterium sp.]